MVGITGAAVRVRKLPNRSIAVSVRVEFAAFNIAVGSTPTLMVVIQGLKQERHYQLGVIDWEFSLLTDPVDTEIAVFLVQSPDVPATLETMMEQSMATIRQSFRIGAGTLTVAQTTKGEISNLDVGMISESEDGKLSIIARAETSVTLRVTGYIEITETIIQREWVGHWSTEEMAAIA